VLAASRCLETARSTEDWEQVALARRFLNVVLTRLSEGK
jgi:hypothetical protein